ncbi:MAG: glycosyltransferase family 4 protein, partial [Anaerolineales bacterium]
LRLPYAAFFESLRFAQACRKELRGFDLLYERMGWVGYGGGLAALSMGTPLVMEVNGDHLSEFEMLGVAPKGLQRLLSIKMMKLSIRLASHFIACGDGWRDRLIARWDIAPRKVSTVENGSVFVERLSRERLRSFRNGSHASEPVTLVFVGGLQPWQGVEQLISSFAQALQRGVNARLQIIGSGPNLIRMQRLAFNKGVAGSIIFIGDASVPELAEILTNADVGVSPYCGRVEFSGLKIFDYKAAGLPTIASGQNGYPGCLKHESTGLVVPPCDEAALCEAIVRLAHDADLRRRLGRQARNEAEQAHSWTHTAMHLERVLERLIG